MAGRLADLQRWRMPRVAAGPAAGLRISRAGASADYARGTNELPVQVALFDLLAPGDVFLDIGANVGFFSLLAARAVRPVGQVYAAEPVPANAEQIRRGARRNRLRIDVLELAITDRAETTTLQLAIHPGGAAVASAAAPPDPAGTIDVETDTVDRLVSSGRIRVPSVVKIDVEGAETEVLRGMAATLASHRPAVICEIDGADQGALDRKRSEVTAVLEAAGYRIDPLDPSYEGSEWLVEHVVARAVDAP
jgi:FkbM family methyltransferase